MEDFIGIGILIFQILVCVLLPCISILLALLFLMRITKVAQDRASKLFSSWFKMFKIKVH